METVREIIRPPTPGLDALAQYGQWQSVAVRAAGFIFCSGVVAVDPATGVRLLGTVAGETVQCMRNLEHILDTAGTSLSKIVQIHALLYDRIEYDNFNRAYRGFVPDAPPARSVWSVQIQHGFKVEIDAVALA